MKTVTIEQIEKVAKQIKLKENIASNIYWNRGIEKLLAELQK